MAHVLLMGPRHHLPANIMVGDAPPHCRHDITSHLDFVLNSHVESLVEIGRDRWILCIRTILSQIASLFRDNEKEG